MIGLLRGTLRRKTCPCVIVDAAGVGYEVDVPLSTFENLPAEGETVSLEILTLFRSDSLQLFGFEEPLEKAVFQLLLSVGGIGPKLALAIMSDLRPSALAEAVSAENADTLQRIPGVGQKTARRIVLELREKLEALEIATQRTVTGVAGGSLSATFREALSALESLGFKRNEAERAVHATRATSGADLDLAELIRGSLQRLRGGR